MRTIRADVDLVLPARFWAWIPGGTRADAFASTAPRDWDCRVGREPATPLLLDETLVPVTHGAGKEAVPADTRIAHEQTRAAQQGAWAEIRRAPAPHAVAALVGSLTGSLPDSSCATVPTA